MDFPSRLTSQLDALSVALEDSGDDLQAILSVLTDDLKAAVPSFTGVSVTVQVDGEPITIYAADPNPAAASMYLPLAAPSGSPGVNHIVFYARYSGAFTDLAAAHSAAGLDGGVVLDRHLPPPHADGAEALARRSEIDQAIGVLIEAGHHPEQARQHIHTRADATGVTPHHIALEILHHLEDDTPQV